MPLLLTGLVLLLGAQQLTRDAWHTRLAGRFGSGASRAGVAALGLIALAFIMAGYGDAAYVFVWFPPPWLRLFLLPLLFVAFVLLAAELVPSNFRYFLRRPFNWSVLVWALAHLSVRGDLAAIVLFGGLGSLALIAILKPDGSGRRPQRTRLPWIKESLTVAVGGILFIVFFYSHMALFGSSPSMMRGMAF